MKFVHAVFIDKEGKFDKHYIHQSGIPLLTEYVRSRKKKKIKLQNHQMRSGSL